MHRLKVQYLSRKDINENAWNHVVRHSPFNRVYAFTWFLDHMTEQAWTGIVIDDYEAVFPVFIKKKLFLQYITTPPLCQQLGLFTSNEKNKEIYVNAIQKSLQSYLKAELTLHTGSDFKRHCTPKTNHVLHLNESYEILKKGYNRNTTRNINNAQKAEIKIEYSTDVAPFLDFALRHEPSGSISQIYTQLNQLISHTLLQKNGQIIAMSHEGNAEAMAYFIDDNERIYFLVCASSDKGKEMKLMYVLIDYLIQKYAGTNKIFDFTGSNMPQIARRNLSFGAISEEYYFLKMKFFG